MVCQRCRKETNAHTMSRFDTQDICLDCREKEKRHPKYAEAVAAELAEVRKGNYNFPGIGKPADL